MPLLGHHRCKGGSQDIRIQLHLLKSGPNVVVHFGLLVPELFEAEYESIPGVGGCGRLAQSAAPRVASGGAAFFDNSGSALLSHWAERLTHFEFVDGAG
jgi:hypothetical protein